MIMGEKIKHKKLYALSQTDKKHIFSIPLRESIKIGKREYPIFLKSDEKHGTYILWKNRRYPVEIVRSRQNRYEILFNDVSYNFTVETPFSMQRRTFLASSVKGKTTEIIKAPMPGKIIDVLAKEGSTVSRGEAVVILEAMKMQNEIQTPVAGTVKRVHVRPDMNVMKDDILAEIEPAVK
ncbi:MAG: acetyl-CoA carboxylase biotin carboxyl carrier protein subunit [Bacteroidetes bacterium]|nr:acetyl-CoA carboxylase biotin carboxyl carrier protein subunit [Bacteroidota bacterium]